MSHDKLPAAIFTGALVSDPERRHIEGSEPRPCCQCGEPVMFSQATLARVAEHDHVRFACLGCAVTHKLLDGITLFPPDGAQLRELEQAGHDPEAWPLRDQWGKKLSTR